MILTSGMHDVMVMMAAATAVVALTSVIRVYVSRVMAHFYEINNKSHNCVEHLQLPKLCLYRETI